MVRGKHGVDKREPICESQADSRRILNMPVASQIAQANGSFRFNADLLDKSLEGVTAEEWGRCPCESSNSLTWIAGHIVWARSRTLAMMGTEWSKPWLPLFARGSKQAEAGDCPSSDEILAAWNEVKAVLDGALENASAEKLNAPGPERVPSFDGKLSGTIAFMANHESYHVGQAAYLRRWLGHGQISG
jgi:uncharacterized damage-inducible protein DinB